MGIDRTAQAAAARASWYTARLLCGVLSACGSHHRDGNGGNGAAGNTSMESEVSDECLGPGCISEGEACTPYEPMMAFDLSSHRDDQVGSCSPACSELARSQGSCGDAAGADAAFHWTAPSEGFYVFEVAARASEASAPFLYVLDGECTGPERACVRDNAVGVDGAVSRVLLHAQSGQAFTAVVELPFEHRATQETLEHMLSIEQTGCPVESLSGTVPLQQEFQLSETELPLREVSCNEGAVVAQAGARFTAPTAGAYEFELTPAAEGTAILALYYDDCLGIEYGCRAGTAQDDVPLILWAELAQGQDIVAVMAVEQSAASSHSLRLDVRNAPAE